MPSASSPVSPAELCPPRHPFVYTVLIIPFGATTGFVTVALAYLATKRGLTVQQGAELVAVSMFPQIWKVIWAPIADTTLSRRTWYVIATICCAAGMFITAAMPLGIATFRWIEVAVFLSSVAAAFVGFAVEAMMTRFTSAAERGRVSGWYQAGNLGAGAIGGGLGLWLLETLPAGWETGLILAGLVAGCAAALPLLPNLPADPRRNSVGSEIRNVVAKLWALARTRNGALSALLCFVPVGTGSALGVLAQASVAGVWGAGSSQVELVQGFLGGVVSMIGCIAGGYGSDRLGGRTSYVVYGGMMAAVTLAMALLPRTPAAYVAGTLAYSLMNGLCFAAFSAFVLEVIGGELAATKYNGFASLSNTPIWYMGLALAAAETRFGAKGMLLTESACGVLGIVVFSAVARVKRPGPKAGAAA
jgi:PAT family beta-lactamase induction signal transducer AmpG